MQKPLASYLDDILSQADIILPSQYFASVGSSKLSGEQRLSLALLIDAINVLQDWKGNGSPRKRRDFAEALHWVNTHGTHHPFSFDSVCDVLNINSEMLRSRLRIFTVRPASSDQRPSLGHLRLKELSRSKNITANRAPRRKDVRATTATTQLSLAISALPQVESQPLRNSTVEPNDGLAAFGSQSRQAGGGASVNW
jgi:hypothetical protein